ncbi:phosphatidate cytidylyltransferase [Metabacillus iocasae]|uniref:Phosphatidate cytidylyltransferase n=1 Tax=Priestia iocasae TaxID=2291674 RepID=A0ABS2QR22_9BACI|nr:phosphatidate cytidylyltransferase [Metabacillus iocasae]MBM7701897.1 phosphatidate cytidylyltransferase [Metabacillus iocasae]
MKQRIITAVIAIAVFAPIVFAGGLPFTLMIYLLATIGVLELLRMKKISAISFPSIISILLLWVFLLPRSADTTFQLLSEHKVEVALLAVLTLLSYTVLIKNQFTFDDVAFILLSTIYVGMGFYYFIEIRQEALVYVFFVLFIIWATDSGAYFIGRAIGKRKLWPEISPNKTIEGFVGGIVCAIVVVVLFSLMAPLEQSLSKLLLIGVMVSVFGQIGDLVESALKRHYEVKDSGNILPGHGGILDRFDSLLFVLPILYFLLML